MKKVNEIMFTYALMKSWSYKTCILNQHYYFQYVCHQKTNLKYSPDKLWYIACLVRGMTVDEAVKQLSFVNKKGAQYVKDAILEAQDLAVTQHNVEFRSNLWIGMFFNLIQPCIEKLGWYIFLLTCNIALKYLSNLLAMMYL